jgi:hypothetical protein
VLIEIKKRSLLLDFKFLKGQWGMMSGRIVDENIGILIKIRASVMVEI